MDRPCLPGLNRLTVLLTLVFALWTGAIGCAGANPQKTAPPSKPPMTRYLALGDSYTIGESVAESERFPVQLVARLKKDGHDLGAPWIIARTGWTTDELDAAITAAGPTGPFDLVTLLIGVNNQYRKRDAEQYRGEFRALLKRAVGFAGGDPSRVIVVSIPDWCVTPFAKEGGRANEGGEIDRYNRVNREETEAAHAKYIDITPISREAVNDPALLAEDGLHPSGKMYGRWVELIVPAVKK
jgi:lysophospholipase L1-like esterase